MSSELLGPKAEAEAKRPAIRVDNVSKHYVMFERPEDRFKQMVVPRLQRLAGRQPKRYYRDFAALNDVSLEVGRGETVGIIGRNGSGKSTLLQIICGTLRPTSGTVEVNGRIAALLELGAGFNPEFTGRENVFLNAQILGVPRREMEWRFDDIARFADIGAFIDQPVKTYSSGMYVRLAFATAINVDPDILVVDEALAVGDEAFQRKCFGRLEDIKDKGGTILFVSHGAQAIVQLCTRAILIDAGQKLLEGKPKTVVSQYQRLVHASAAGTAEIRKQIQSIARDVASGSEEVAVPDTSLSPSSATQDVAAATVPRTDIKDGTADYFDPSLVSQSAHTLEERGALIKNLRIATLGGERVNVLRMGKRYVIEYDVAFSAAAHGVGAGFMIKSVQGAGLAGSHTGSSALYRLSDVQAGSTYSVRFEFNCALVPGTYFVNCGVNGHADWGFGPLHRQVDALVFRVAPEPDLIVSGYFDLGSSHQISVVGNA